MRQIGSTVSLAFALISGCKFSPEQLLLPEPMQDQSDAGVGEARGATTAAPGSSTGGRRAVPAATGGSMSSQSAAAGSSGKSAAPSDASVDMPSRRDAAMALGGTGGSTVGGSGGATAAGSGGEPAGPSGPADATCDLTGVWSVKQIAVGLALEEPQYMNNWAYYEIEQTGTSFVVKRHIDCGAEVIGSGTVTLTRATMEGTVKHNMQNGRQGSFQLVDGKCVFDIARFWSVRGAEEERFLPNPTRDSTMSMAELARLKPLPTPRMTDGAFDLEGDGKLGTAGQINGIVSGVRNSCQRDWDRWFTEPGYEITPAMSFDTDLKIRIEYESEESVMSPTSGLLTTPTEPTNDWKHVTFLRFLGRSLDDPRAKAIVKAEDVETCYAIQDAMPAEELQR